MSFNVELYTHDRRSFQSIVLFHPDYSTFSNFAVYPFVIDGQTYPTVTHYYESQKARYFADYNTMNKILAAAGPRKCRMLARDIAGFDSTQWRRVCDSFMLSAVMEKFLQNGEARKKLLQTGNRVIAKADAFDRYWGIGLAINDDDSADMLCWSGLNKLGTILTIVRSILQ